MRWETWSLFVATEAVLCFTPGPAVLLVLSQALSRGAAKSVLSTCGILAANGFYFVLSATSLGALLAASHKLFSAIKWIGAAYLVYLGLSALFNKASVLVVPQENPRAAGNARLFLNGFTLQAANPKALVFFTALLPQFVDPARPVTLQVAILGVSSIVVEFWILLGYGVLAGKATGFARQPRFAAVTNRIAGALLIGAAAGLASLSRS